MTRTRSPPRPTGPVRCLRRTWTGTATSTCSSASSTDDTIAWYENDGSQDFTAQTITTAADGARSVFAADVDGDGDIDVLSRVARRRHDRLVRERRQPGSSPTQIITTAADGAQSVFAADVDGDGDMDVLSASSRSTTRSPGTRTTAAQTFTAAHHHHRGRRSAVACLRRTWTATATWTCSPRRATTTRSPGTRTTAARVFTAQRIIRTAADGARSRVCGGRGRRRRHRRALRVLSRRQDRLVRERRQPESSRHTPSPPPPTGPVACLRRTWTATATSTCSRASYSDDKIAWYENDGSQELHAAHASPPRPMEPSQRLCGGRGRRRRHGRALRVIQRRQDRLVRESRTAVPEMDVWGNAVSIADGDTTPGMADDTDFGAAFVAGGTVSHTFTIANTLGGDLSLTGMPRVMVNGIHAGDFSVTVQPDSPVIGQTVTTFTVVFDPGAVAGLVRPRSPSPTTCGRESVRLRDYGSGR